MRNTTKHVSVNVEIEAPGVVVFNTVTDWEKQNKWVYLTKVRGLGDNAPGLGGKLVAFTGIGRIGFVDTMTVTNWEANTLCEVTHTGNVVKGRGVFEVSEHNLLTTFTWTEYIELPFGYIGGFGWLLIKPVAIVGLKLSLLRLKNHIESST